VYKRQAILFAKSQRSLISPTIRLQLNQKPLHEKFT
jgi:hypothetical protein